MLWMLSIFLRSKGSRRKVVRMNYAQSLAVCAILYNSSLDNGLYILKGLTI